MPAVAAPVGSLAALWHDMGRLVDLLHSRLQLSYPADALEPQLSDRFESLKELRLSEWFGYLDGIYGASTLRFPLSLRQLGFFYTPRLPKPARFREHPRSQPTQQGEANVLHGPIQRGELYRTWGGEAHGTAWAQLNLYRMLHAFDGRWAPTVDAPVGAAPHIGPSFGIPSGFASHTRVEVMHRVGDARGSGMWFYYARGSGVYFDVGRTAVYRDHLHAAQELGITPCARGSAARLAEFPGACNDAREFELWWSKPDGADQEFEFQSEATRRGAAAGYDSIQFARHLEHDIWHFEILATNVFEAEAAAQGDGGGPSACPDPRYAARFSRGWGGTEACVCRAALDVNCDGETVTTQASVRGPSIEQQDADSYADAPVLRRPSTKQLDSWRLDPYSVE